MPDLILNAIPFFLAFMAIEVLALRHAAHEHAEGSSGPVGYAMADTRTSVAMGLGSLVVKGVVKLGAIALYAALYELSPLRMDPSRPWSWVILFFADDLSFYLYHRGHHRVRMLWASHVVHHSSQHFNLSTAVRQDWSPFTGVLFWAWLPLIGFAPWMIVLAMSWNLLFQFLLHTEAVDKLPRPIEWVFNTPSHHRVHHGSQPQYLDRNYAGILIVWDRLFGSFEPEGERVRYGLTKNIETYNPVRVAYGEWLAMFRDTRRARGWRAKLGHVLRPPGWQPEHAAASSAGRDRAEQAVALVAGAGAEHERVVAGEHAVAEPQAPQAVERDRVARGVAQATAEVA